jgi:glucose-6-phosphate 1-dehydrogenase
MDNSFSKNTPTILVIFGATGDLVRRKLAPALFYLWRKGMMPNKFRVVGFTRRAWGNKDYRDYIGGVLIGKNDRDKGDISAFLRLLSCVKGNFDSPDGYQTLKNTLEGINREWGGPANKLFYLAATPEFYQTIFENIAASGLSTVGDARGGWARIIVEKPFGKDSNTAEELDRRLGKLFPEEQIYRIDHYLAKEMLQNILAFRFSNNLLEENWSHKAIEKINIIVREEIGVEERGAFYDGIGALRDVGQNHLLQMAALIAMEQPQGYEAGPIRDKRVELLKQLKIPSSEEIKQTSIRSQYEGYRGIKGVKPDSDTETYFKVQAFIDSPRWRGVPFILESGKKMPEQRKEVNVIFKHPTPCLCPKDRHYQNKIVFGIEPEERITIHFLSKKPGLTFEMEKRIFDFLLRDVGKRTQYVEEYEKLLLDCITGDQTLFVSTDEIRAMWRFIDPIIYAWRRGVVPLKFYKPGTQIAYKWDD